MRKDSYPHFKIPNMGMVEGRGTWANFIPYMITTDDVLLSNGGNRFIAGDQTTGPTFLASFRWFGVGNVPSRALFGHFNAL